MENTNVKSKKGLVIFLIIVMIVLFAVLTLFFAGILKSPFVKETSTVTNTSTTSETTKETSTTKTSNERYKDYISNLAKSIDEKYKEVKDYENPGLNNESVYNKNDVTGLGYIITINEKKELKIKYISGVDKVNPDYVDYKIADNVVSYYRIHIGNGEYYSLFYITTEGKVYSASIENGIETAITTKEVENVKNIVEVKEGSGLTAGFPIYVDIDGNIFTPDVVE